MNLQEAIGSLESAIKDALDSSLKEAIKALEEVVKAALLDDMTPLGNSQALRLAASSVGKGEDASDVVVFGDLNGLKNLNEEFGYAAGDAAIGEVGKLIKTLLVEQCGAQAFRRSGDEFVVLLSSRSLGQFKDRVGSFASCSFQVEEETRKTAMSFGYAVSSGEADFASLIARAEIACKLAKFQDDESCVEWSEEIEREVRDSSRGRCKSCGARFECSMPRLLVRERRRLSPALK